MLSKYLSYIFLRLLITGEEKGAKMGMQVAKRLASPFSLILPSPNRGGVGGGANRLDKNNLLAGFCKEAYFYLTLTFFTASKPACKAA